MRIIGLVSFWDESPTWLAATISSMGRFCDHVCVLDGRYAMFPDARMQSGTAEHYAAIDAARAVGMGITLHTAPRTFTTEMDKRTKLFQLGMLEADPLHDWFFVLDADEVVAEVTPTLDVTAFLESQPDHVSVATCTLWEKADPHLDADRTEASMKLAMDWRYENVTPRFWRAHHNMRCVGYHYNYLGEDADGRTVELWGHDDVVRSRPGWASLTGRIVIENRNRMRAKARDNDRQQYYNDRDAAGIEEAKPLEAYQGVGA